MWTDDYPFSIARPPHVVSGLFPKLDAGLLGAIGDAMTSNQISDALRHRLFRALDWFRLANTNSDDVPWRTKVVMMATAFGTLLDIQGQRKAAEIADFLDKCSPPNAIKQKIKDSKGKEIERTIQGLWGRKFYRVRNQITHGDQVTAQTVHFMHGRAGSWLNDLIVANIVFGQCVGDILHQQGMLPHPLNLSDIYRDFGWVR
jgi:hypothetical protein